MAGADPFRTGNTAFRLGLGKALVPFVFVYGPAMLVVTPEFTWPGFLFIVLSCVAGIVMLSAAFAGYALAPLAVWERCLLGIAALPTIAPSVTPTLVGLALASPVVITQVLKARAAPRPAPA